jgi:mono/diheme cytochrome c family protein
MMRALHRLLLVLVLALLACGNAARAQDLMDFGTVQRGRALAIAGDCEPCHTQPGGAPFAGGRAIATPFGTVVSANITPDRETGIGAWTAQDFLRALQRGIGDGGKHLYPAMPYVSYHNVARDDLLAIRAYLATLPPVRHRVVSNELPFPLDIRLVMVAWNWLFADRTRWQPDPTRQAAWNRGGYLVNGLGHCAACHTAQNFLGAPVADAPLGGGAVQGWFAPALDGSPRTGLGAWSEAEIVAYLANGRNDRDMASGPMREVVEASTARMPQADLHAIAVYLKSLPTLDSAAPPPIPAGDPTMQQGAAIYADACSACHKRGGEGLPGLIPRLSASAAVQSRNPASLVRVVACGARSAATDTAPVGSAMPPFAWKLAPGQIAAVLTYLRNSWGNAASRVDAEQAAPDCGGAASTG